MDLLHFEVLDSTNTYLKTNWNTLNDRTVVLADRQTAGRGRLGRVWETPSGNLSFSMLFKNCTGEVSLFPLAAAVAAAEAVEALCGEPIGIKWPNDLILRGKKLCGILCESVFDGETFQIICGIGVNLNLPQTLLDEVNLPHATSLSICFGQAPDAAALAVSIAENLSGLVDLWQKDGFAPVMARYQQRLLNVGREVLVIQNGKPVKAFAKGVDENGHLLCENENGSFSVHSGEASVRGLYGYL